MIIFSVLISVYFDKQLIMQVKVTQACSFKGQQTSWILFHETESNFPHQVLSQTCVNMQYCMYGILLYSTKWDNIDIIIQIFLKVFFSHSFLEFFTSVSKLYFNLVLMFHCHKIVQLTLQQRCTFYNTGHILMSLLTKEPQKVPGAYWPPFSRLQLGCK